MTYPQQTQQYPPQGYQQPGFPQAPPPSPGYPPMPPQGYGPPQGQVPQQPLAQGTLDGYFAQPSTGGGKAWSFDPAKGGKPTHVGIVARAVTNADVEQQTNLSNGQPAFYKDGRPKFVMKVPMKVQPDEQHPDGLAQWYVAGAQRDELVRAMAEAGAPVGPPEAGAVIQVTKTGTRPVNMPGMSPAGIYAVQYRRPDGAAPVPAPAQQVTPPTQVPQPEVQAPAPAPAAQPAAPAPAKNEQATPLSDEQQKLLASLTGQPTG